MISREQVFEELNNGAKNAPEITTWNAREIADDLMSYCEPFENSRVDELIPHIEAWISSLRSAH